MADLPTVTGQEAVRAFEQLGWVVSRIRGSHHILRKEGHRQLLSVPVHSGQTLKRGTLSGLLRASGVTRDDFIAAL